MTPGCTELARIPSLAYWMAVDLVSSRTAPFEAPYAEVVPPTSPATEEMLMMEPPPAFRISGMAALVPRKTPLAFTSITWSHWLSGRASMVIRSPEASLGAAYARVVHQDIQPAEAGHGGLHGILPVRFTGNVQVDVQALAAGLIDFRLYLRPQVIQDVADDHPGPFSGEHPGFNRTLPPGSAADQSYLSFQSRHHFPLLRSNESQSPRRGPLPQYI